MLWLWVNTKLHSCLKEVCVIPDLNNAHSLFHKLHKIHMCIISADDMCLQEHPKFRRVQLWKLHHFVENMIGFGHFMWPTCSSIYFPILRD